MEGSINTYNLLVRLIVWIKLKLYKPTVIINEISLTLAEKLSKIYNILVCLVS